ncbi:prephenate dehydratase [Dysgonomonas sp. PFB1-18]|uniref:prephenate dehydratase n=1 Tax=unclassified Dysgonomonas TaxID=2630389 RepID=UPI0024758C22|nr:MULTISPECIES: prephenate dehydratase [unclassified Dysgonomonas]MDH6308637.1 prephenate dehydratase [Dysgonomonas sp. PF1-14]MDH6338138.1 prephenate dehydratase [Dysgonomonas sp. PF1-16]MDH6379635.1 prephenate dehydratase [Dysgonomonas sp. PFB1-18]MDH6396965.1 prephenate dehydratase [Dysgonomonas sp. PF1-23]
MRKVAIQGGLGAYHGIAAENFFGEEVEIVPCVTFRDIFRAIKKDPNIIGIMAIENTIAGSLLSNYELLKENKLPIAGEFKQRISHCLAALPGKSVHDIKEIQSHPIALMQCTEFLDTLPGIKIVEHEDTALAARDVAEQNLQTTAAICSVRAAEIYGLNILARGIETNKHNFTRFLIFGNRWIVDEIQKDEVINKSSIVFTLPHSEGSLSKVLSVLSFYGISLTKIQSLPIIGREWEYQFYVDLTYSDIERYHQSLDAIRPLISELKTLGEYPEGRQSEL